jgi:hypothetical protein
MSNTLWGPITWYLLHGLTRKIKQDSFNKISTDLVVIIIELLNNLPCPECAEHSILFMSKVNFNNIKCKEDLETIIFELHNSANKNTKKPTVNKDILKMYDKLNIPKTLVSFNAVFNTKGNMNLLMQTHNRELFLKKFNTWFNSNKPHFNI